MPDTLAKLESERSELLEQFLRLGDLRPGSITAVVRRCGKPTCHCAKPNDPGHDPQVRLTRRVAGKTITVSSSTRFDVNGNDDSAAGSGSLASIKVGDFIEVTGATDATSGSIAATKIEVKSDQELNEDGQDKHTEFKGAVSGFIAGATSFKLKSVTVNCTGTCVLPAGLKDGDFVEVDGTLASDGTLTANRIKLEGAKGGKGEGHHDGEAVPVLGSSVMLQDEIRGLNVASSSFNLDGFTVDYAGVTVSGGTLANDVHVKVDGTVDSSNAWLVHATAVTVVADNKR